MRPERWKLLHRQFCAWAEKRFQEWYDVNGEGIDKRKARSAFLTGLKAGHEGGEKHVVAIIQAARNARRMETEA